MCQCKTVLEIDGELTCNDCGLVHDKVFLNTLAAMQPEGTLIDFVAGCERTVGTGGQSARRLTVLAEVNYFDMLADKHTLSKAVTTLAAEKFIAVVESRVIRGNNRKRHRAACLYHAFRELKQPRSIAYIAFLLDMSEADVLAGCNLMDNIETSRIIDTSTGDHVVTVCQELGIHDYKFEQLANKMFIAASKHLVNHPMTVVGACLYVLTRECRLDIPLQSIADACGMSVSVIQETQKRIHRLSAQIQQDMRT